MSDLKKAKLSDVRPGDIFRVCLPPSRQRLVICVNDCHVQYLMVYDSKVMIKKLRVNSDMIVYI